MSFSTLLNDVRTCRHCQAHLSHGARPVVQIHPDAKILIAGQAPGRKVHESGIPFNDPSGERLREWLGVEHDKFYDPKLVAILPMGFCFPGTGKSGDLPPRPECAKLWRERLLAQLQQVELTLVIGKYAQDYHFSETRLSVTDRVRAWQKYWPGVVPLPHPSPRNNIWLARNPWFESELVPALRKRVSELIV